MDINEMTEPGDSKCEQGSARSEEDLGDQTVPTKMTRSGSIQTYAALAAIAIGMSSGHPMIRHIPEPDKTRPYRKCRLEGCEGQTNHPKGYCCADHFKKAKGE